MVQSTIVKMEIKLQKDLDALVDWADTWQLHFNADKRKVLHMGKTNEQHCHKMRKHGSSDRVIYEKSETDRDLCVQVDKDFEFSQHIETHVNKANSLLSPIRRSYEHLDAQSMQLQFVALVRPHLEFGNVV